MHSASLLAFCLFGSSHFLLHFLSSPLDIMHDSDGDQATTAGVATIAVTLPLLIVLASVAIFVYKRNLSSKDHVASTKLRESGTKHFC